MYVNNELTTLKTDIQIKVNKVKAGMLGVPVNEIDRSVRMAIAGLNIGTFRKENGDEYNINVRFPGVIIKTLEALQKVYVTPATHAIRSPGATGRYTIQCFAHQYQAL